MIFQLSASQQVELEHGWKPQRLPCLPNTHSLLSQWYLSSCRPNNPSTNYFYLFTICFPMSYTMTSRVRFLSLPRSKLRLCSANHRAGYFSNLVSDWLGIIWAYSEPSKRQKTGSSLVYVLWRHFLLSSQQFPPHQPSCDQSRDCGFPGT